LLASSALFGFFISWCIALLATPLARRAGVAMGWRDRPDDAHKGHHAARPYAGGLAVLAAIVLSLLAFRIAFADYARVLGDFLLAVGPGALLIAAVGLLDDVRGCRPTEKLVVQAVGVLLFQTSAFALGLTGATTTQTPVILAGAILLNTWMLGLTNSMNLIDGMDGLAAGLATSSAIGIGTMAVIAGDPAVAVCAAVLAGASLGFRRSNRVPARIYLGDGGSLLLGFGLAATGATLWLRNPNPEQGIALILMAWVPLLDTGTTILRRLASGVALFQADRDHLHHRLLARGAGTRSVGRQLIGLNVLGVLAGLAVFSGAPPILLFALIIVASVGALRAALPLQVTNPVPRRTASAVPVERQADAQERAA
jgi:UDP-GlcNAc:undecaprenyl-phosphate GlcNAc-1-phosphate transferase